MRSLRLNSVSVIPVPLPPMSVVVMRVIIMVMDRMASAVTAALDGRGELGERSLDLVSGTRRLGLKREGSVVVRLRI
jgi:hypothetical protein